MSPRKTMSLVAVLLITLGVAWLLDSMGTARTVEWIPVLLLGIGGVMTFALGGFNKVTFFIGSMLIVLSVSSVLTQTEHISVGIEVPALVIVAGVLLLIAVLAPLPSPKWLHDAPPHPGPPGRGPTP
jgi:hypothetical protein